ncbi:hypothetical protein [Micromonospora sp. NPDC049679]|uniref:hypothetical protein n=1 Tax=Micromonospora sp. NPDC049679 TaxID=3155920 RepID=UPI0033EE29BD
MGLFIAEVIVVVMFSLDAAGMAGPAACGFVLVPLTVAAPVVVLLKVITALRRRDRT